MGKNIWMDGIFGVVVGDALGCPVEFKSREIRKADPVEDMREYGTFSLPRGSWTDDSSKLFRKEMQEQLRKSASEAFECGD